MSHNLELPTAMAQVCRICAKVAFIPGTTDIGLDDDLLHLHSRKVVLKGYSQINNPNNGLEPCQTALHCTVVEMLHLTMSASLTESRSYFSFCQGH
jgi:hypothetical protein